jgi:tetratricopeptide (TPR) repeat protein
MASKKHMTSGDLLGFENVVGTGEKIKAYFEENARQIIAISLIVCLSAGAIAYWVISTRASAQASQGLLNQALAAMGSAPPSEAEQTAALASAVSLLSQISETYSRTEAGRAALFYRGQCKLRQKDYSGAIADYQAFLDSSGQAEATLRPFALENIGYAHEAMGDPAEALKWFEQAVQAGRQEALVGMARMHEAAGSMELACDCYQKYLAGQSGASYREFVEIRIGGVCR